MKTLIYSLLVGSIIAGILVPLFVIAGIIACWYYRVTLVNAYQRFTRRDEETMQLTMRNPSYHEHSAMELEISKNDNVSSSKKENEKHHLHHDSA